MVALLLPGHGIGRDVCRLPQQAADSSAVQVRLNLAAVAGRIPNGQHHSRGGGGEEPQQSIRPGNFARGKALQGQHLDGEGFHAGIHVR
jgi:hypothetical protein